ncbi:hypothetical protein MuYL_4034 [Mucilaginibacter xinganensis]|uniref:Uncharacterized protein n=1 Tax=Mucilaginibacter xinganensis TaxID=1234841 RepID=A0A223P196_9SPHI|nr:hypothetical protein MuYL_4034 [Mucilaginibacter xinganensis]
MTTIKRLGRIKSKTHCDIIQIISDHTQLASLRCKPST